MRKIIFVLSAALTLANCVSTPSAATPVASNRPAQNQESDFSIFTYIQYVMNPTMDEVGQSVKLENDTLVIIRQPDLRYEMTDKTTGVTTKGRTGFQMAMDDMNDARTYLQEMDPDSMTRDQFLNSNYTEAAQIEFVTIACDSESVTYKYVKPAELKDQTVTFSITVLPKQ